MTEYEHICSRTCFRTAYTQTSLEPLFQPISLRQIWIVLDLAEAQTMTRQLPD